jgi:predicted neutral ceramidase superfamily lipid hydrolase
METSILTLKLITYFLLGYSTYHIAAYSYMVERYNRTNNSSDLSHWPVQTIFTYPIVNLVALGFHIYICYLFYKQEGFLILICSMITGLVFQGVIRIFFQGKGVYYSTWISLILGCAFLILLRK